MLNNPYKIGNQGNQGMHGTASPLRISLSGLSRSNNGYE